MKPRDITVVGCCPACGVESGRVHEYKKRRVKHYELGNMAVKEFPCIVFRCVNAACKRKTFRVIMTDEGKAEVDGSGRYSLSSKEYIAARILKYGSTYSGLYKEIREAFGGSTSTASLYNWVQACTPTPAPMDNSDVQIFDTDEKQKRKKK